MAKKGQQQTPNKKQIEKEKQREIEDKTFGLKNKNKSKKVQQYVQNVKKQEEEKAKKRMMADKPKQQQSELEKQRKEAEKEAERVRLLRQTLKQPVVPEGENPKNYQCVWFLYGVCDKGDKCKYSHGEKKAQVLTKEQEEQIKILKEQEKEQARLKANFISDDMGTCDIYKEVRVQILEHKAKVISQRTGRSYDELIAQYMKEFNSKYHIDKTCNYFIEACKTKSAGFAWICPNEKQNGWCPYQHFLPEGFDLFPKKEEKDEDLDYEEDEDRIERLRQEITHGTVLTDEVFNEWKQKRKAKQMELEKQQELIKEKEGTWTGKEIFEKGLNKKGDEDEGESVENNVFYQNWRKQQEQKMAEEKKLEQEMYQKAQQEQEQEQQDGQHEGQQ